VVANTVNIGADLGGMAAVMEMMTGVRAFVWIPLFALLIVALLVWSSYRHIARVFKWITLSLLAYVGASFFAHPRWGEVAKATFLPHLEWSARYFATFLGVLGTTISPYLFFWQAAQEVEEERALGHRTLDSGRGATDAELDAARVDVVTGMAYSNVVMAAEALRPLAGKGAYLLFSLGLLGTGMLGVPVLAGSAAYALTEAMHWRGSRDVRPRLEPKFYLVLAAAILIGVILNYVGVSAVKMLFWAAVLNGALAPPLVALITLLTSDRTVMDTRTSSPLLRWLGWATCALMTAATIGIFVTGGR
jgi:Mn2+/Fe2+ NRAMP family transporter